MSNATTLTTVKQEYDLTTESGLIRLAQDAGRDFKLKMMIVVEYWCKPVQKGGQGKKIEDLASKINRSPVTIRKYVTALRKEGRLEAAEQGSRSDLSRGDHGRSLPVENLSTTPCTVTISSTHEKRSYTEPSISSPVQVVQPIVDTYSEEQGHRVVSMGTASDRDWQEAVEHLKALRQFTHDYFDPNGPISEHQWEQFHAECHDLAYFASSRFNNLRKENERTSRSIIGAVFTDDASSIQEA